MLLTTRIAFRYLFSRKSSQAIHWITGISVFGIAVGTAALILVLSVFNGFEDLLSGMFGRFNPDVKLVASNAKFFDEDSLLMMRLRSLDGVEALSRSLEEVAMFQYGDAQEFGMIRGVDSSFSKAIDMGEATVEGSFATQSGKRALANLGSGLSGRLGVRVSDFGEPLRVFLPDASPGDGPSLQAYQDFPITVQSTYSFQQESDYNTAITDLDYLRERLNRNGVLSAIDLRVKKGYNPEGVARQVQTMAGPGYIAKDRYRQDEAFFKIMKLEKWLFYALFSLTLVLVSFTIVGALWMVVLEKRFDITVLKCLGMENRAAKSIFIWLSWYICLAGLTIGFGIALGFYALQKEYGLIGVPAEFIIDAYPIQLRLLDFFLVSVTVLLIGFLASAMPAQKVGEIQPVFREE